MPAVPRFRATRRELLDLDGEGWRVELDPERRRSIREVVARPAVVYRLFVERPGTRVAIDAWADRTAMALQAEVDPGEPADVVAGDLALLPSSIATAVGLGPRLDPTSAQAVVARGELRAALLEGRPIDGLGAIATVWSLVWVDGAAPGPGITVVDGGPDGPLWVAAGVEGDEILLRDEGTLAVWVRLGELLGLPRSAPGSEAGEPDLDDAVVAAE